MNGQILGKQTSLLLLYHLKSYWNALVALSAILGCTLHQR